MRRRPRQISLRECYDILRLEKGADLQAVKRAYRKRAFELHPDLNPNNPEASRQFQLLNEAYVALTAMLKPAEEARQKAEAQKAAREEAGRKSAGGEKREEARPEGGDEASAGQDRAGAEKTGAEKDAGRAGAAYAEQNVLRDLLNDPFARRVFEDIYSELNRQQTAREPEPEKKVERQPREAPEPRPAREARQVKAAPLWQRGQDKGVKGAVKDWLRNQLDEEQSLVLPATGLVPGRKIRLKVRRGLSDEVNAVEVTLPADFAVGKPMRLRGLGKRVGPWQGDLYLTIHSE